MPRCRTSRRNAVGGPGLSTPPRAAGRGAQRNLATTVADITTEAGRSAASLQLRLQRGEMVRALRSRRQPAERIDPAAYPTASARTKPLPPVVHYRNRLAEAISVSQLAMVSDDFAQYWSEAMPDLISFITETVKNALRRTAMRHGDDPS